MGSINKVFTAQEIQELAEFWSEEGEAVTLYFEPPAPTELAHREEPILAKESLQQRLTTLRGQSRADREDIQRILNTIAGMQGNHRRTKVIFACARQKFWREFDLLGDFGVRIEVSQSFAIAPLIAQQQARRRYCIALADRNKARLLLLESREISEHSQVLDEDKEKIRTTGARKSAHLERKKEEKVRQHFAFLADHLLHFHEHGDYDGLLIGCRDEMWPEIESALHPELRRILTGRFAVDPGMATCEEISELAQVRIDEKDRLEEQDLLQKAIGGAASDGLGAIGLQGVIEAMERGEVWTLLWPKVRATAQPAAAATLCPNCGHLDRGPARACPLCGTGMRWFGWPEEALLRHANRNSVETRMLAHVKLPQEIAARLRFLARHNTAQALAS